jgi:ribosomal protection tetracycline resistance protein
MELINLGFLAHVDAGKTTTVEQLLYLCGVISHIGSVDKGDTQTDWLPIERRRGISVQSAFEIMSYNNVEIHLIDTPGHTDFIGEVERALSVVDCAVLLVSALEGIQSQTEVFWKALREHRIPTVVFVNKVDRQGVNLAELSNKLNATFSGLLPLNAVENAGVRDCRVYDTGFTEENIFTLSEFDDILADKYLAGEAIEKNEIQASLQRLTAACRVFPMVYGAASLGKGTRRLLDTIVTYLPKTKPAPGGPVSGIVYKISHDKTDGKIAHVRLFSGELHNRDTVLLRRGPDKTLEEKVTQIRRASGQKFLDTGHMSGGEIAALYGLTEAKTGDWIGEILQAERGYFNLAEPLFSVKLLSDAPSSSLLQAIIELTDEDPLLDYYWNNDERELIIKIMGPIQLEILSYLMKERYNLDVTFSPPTVIYKETPIKAGRGFEAYTMPKPCWAIVDLAIAPLPRGSGLKFSSEVKAEDILVCYQHHVETSVGETLKQGLYGWETVDLSVRLVGGQYHVFHTHPMDFFLATPIAVMRGLTDCGTRLLEPMNLSRITATEEFLPKVIGEILRLNGTFDSPVIEKGKFEMDAVLPVALSMDFPTYLSSLTAGKGLLRTKFSGYRECPEDFHVSTKRRGVDPLDVPKWILTMRSALG